MRKLAIVLCLAFMAACDGETDNVVFADELAEPLIDPTLLATCTAPAPKFDEFDDLHACGAPAPEVYQHGLAVLVEAGVRCSSFDRMTGACLAVDEVEAAEHLANKPFIGCTYTDAADGMPIYRVCCVWVPDDVVVARSICNRRPVD